MANPVFLKIGGTYQMRLRDAADLAQIHRLDAARWTVTSVPVKDFRCDPAFLGFLDREKNGRILVNEVVMARDWLFARLANHSALGSDVLALAALDPAHAEAQAIGQAVRRVLSELDAKDQATLSLTQLRDYRRRFTTSIANGDGILAPEAIPDADVAQAVRDIISVVGSVPEASGRPGIRLDELNRFLDHGKLWIDWRNDVGSADLQWTGGQPEDALSIWKLMQELAPKIDLFFHQCELIRAEPAIASRYQMTPETAAQLELREVQAITGFLANAPLARPNAEGLLPLGGKDGNPHYADRLKDLARRVVEPLLGPGAALLSREQWLQLQALLSAFNATMGRRPAEYFEALGFQRVHELLHGPMPERIREYLQTDLAASADLSQMENLEKLILYQRWLLEFTRNFVSLIALYDPREDALFERGSMVIDGRRLEFTVQIGDREEHKKLAAESRLFIVYAQVLSREGTPLYEIAAPVTRGDRGRLKVGKRGIFETLSGETYDVIILDLIENPVSVAEAVRAPFRRLGEFIEKKISDFAEARAATAEAKLQATALAAPATATAVPAPTPVPAPPTPPPAKAQQAGFMAATLAGGGLAVAALGSAGAYILSALSRIRMLDLFVTLLTLLAAVVAIFAFLGWLRLRRRDMAPFLEANGWAVNPQLRVSGRLARVFNRNPPLPPDHEKRYMDLKAAMPPDERDRKFSLTRVVVAVLVVLLFAVPIFFFLIVKPERDRLKPEMELVRPRSAQTTPQPTAEP